MGAGSPASGSSGELWCALSLCQENASRRNSVSGQETRRWMCFPCLAYLSGSASPQSPALFVCARLLARGQEMIRQQILWRTSPGAAACPCPAETTAQQGVASQGPNPRAGCSCTRADGGEGGGKAALSRSCSGTT